MPYAPEEKAFILEQLIKRISALDLDQLKRLQDYLPHIERRAPSLLDRGAP